jgi:Uma2 family endonuclease
MSAQPAPRRYTVDEYFEIERTSEVRYEYDNGEIFAMTGGSRNHNRITKKIVKLLDIQIEDKGECESFLTDVRVGISDRKYVYPDIFVVCGDQDVGRQETILNPTVVFEILSDSTQAYDHRGKFQHYRKISALTDYILVAQDRVLVVHHQRNGATWQRFHSVIYSETTDLMPVESIGCTLSLAAIYANIRFPSLPDDELSDSE